MDENSKLLLQISGTKSATLAKELEHYWVVQVV